LNKKILIVFGTRPEAIKMAPLIKTLDDSFEVKVCVTAQHREMLDDVLKIFDIVPDYDLNLMKPGQDLYDITSSVITSMRDVITEVIPDLVLVHGDTTTTFASSLAAFYSNCPVGHIEAGLRTFNIHSPFPEELNRQIVTKLTNYHFCPTESNKQNLLQEGVKKDQIVVTGNTVIDALMLCVDSLKSKEFDDELSNQLNFIHDERKKMILVTGHRRENFGVGFINICKGILRIAESYPEIEIVYPVHLNPNVQEPVNKYLKKQSNVHLIKPQGYENFVQLMKRSYIILTDSGGIQEEAPSLGKPVLVLRDTSERMEAVKSGTVKIVGTNPDKIFLETQKLIEDENLYKKMREIINPYGDGTASLRIKQYLLKEFK
jgi:UDP-N-acetylglucosamine 2-epimerase (non-hydrolysing)